MIYADSSFIVSAYAEDANSVPAKEFIKQNGPRLPFIFLHWPEIARAFWGNHPDPEQRWEQLQEDLAGGNKLYPHNIEADAVARRAAGMMKHFCPRWKKLRSLDVLHVSAAVTGHFRTFLSFDTASLQRVLAHTQKLSVWPPLTVAEQKQLK